MKRFYIVFILLTAGCDYSCSPKSDCEVRGGKWHPYTGTIECKDTYNGACKPYYVGKCTYDPPTPERTP
jgi:hypothetical protein